MLQSARMKTRSERREYIEGPSSDDIQGSMLLPLRRLLFLMLIPKSLPTPGYFSRIRDVSTISKNRSQHKITPSGMM